MPPFKLVASMMVGPGEEDRYLLTVLDHLGEFCDEIRIRVEGLEYNAHPESKVKVLEATSSFFQHEGMARQQLLDFTVQAQPTHILTIDADEFVTDGPGLRRFLENSRANVFTLSVQEVWKAEPDQLGIRIDGGWRPSEAPILYRVPPRQRLRINNRVGGCGREPTWVRNQRHRQHTGHALLHFGWTNEPDRAARYARYADRKDFGHNPAHIMSIMWPDDKVKLTWRGWDGVPEGYRQAIMERANRGADVEWVLGEDGTLGIVRDSVLNDVMDWNSRDGVVFDSGLHAHIWRHPDGVRWVRVGWDGTVEHGP